MADAQHMAAPWPSELNSARQGQGLELRDKYTVRYIVDLRHHNSDVGAIQANHPCPSNCTVYYFEVTILDHGVYGKIAIGFADRTFKLTRQPGWEVGSYGYHGDDGKKFIGSGAGEDYGPTFGAGDTVGAGIHLGRQELFFTKNGAKLKVAHRPMRAGLYPTIGLHSKGEMVQVNFGQKPWVFDLEGMLAEEKAAQRAAVERFAVSPGTTHLLVRQYLLHYGYADTLAAFDEAAGTAGADEGGSPRSSAADAAASSTGDGASTSASSSCSSASAATLGLRSSLRRCLLSGDVDGSLQLLRAHCPSLLSDHGRYGDVHFQLACQKYIELVRSGHVEEAVRFAQGTLSSVRGRSAGELERTLQDVVALVAYQNPEASPLAHLMGQAQREGVADSVNAAVLAAAAQAGLPGPTGLVAGKGAGGAGALEQETPGGSGDGGAGGSAALPLRPAVVAAAAGSAAGRRPVSHVEGLLQQLVTAQGALHEANGGQGGAFVLREHMLGPAA